jgi:hypothetical protein
MNTVNETGDHKGRYLFTVFETGHSGVQRHDLLTGATDTIWQSPVPGDHVSFDPSFWTPWGTLITGEESWATIGDPGYPTRYGRLVELKNPIAAPGIFNPLTPASNRNAQFVHQNVIPRTSRIQAKASRAGHRTARWDRSSRDFTSTRPTNAGPGQYPASCQWQRPHHRDHDSTGEVESGNTGAGAKGLSGPSPAPVRAI